jgi:hypothetical protein
MVEEVTLGRSTPRQAVSDAQKKSTSLKNIEKI